MYLVMGQIVIEYVPFTRFVGIVATELFTLNAPVDRRSSWIRRMKEIIIAFRRGGVSALNLYLILLRQQV